MLAPMTRKLRRDTQLEDETKALLSTLDPPAAARFAADCAERVLSLFESAVPGDDRPRRAIAAARADVPIVEAREAALAAHAAAKDTTDPRATWAALAAGHAAATLQDVTHAPHAAADATKAAGEDSERSWQRERLRQYLRP
jgi:hypothetical protein